MDVIKKLKSVGIPVVALKKPPVHSDLFGIGLNDNNKYEFWIPPFDSKVKINVSTNKRLKQAVINVNEGTRKIREEVDCLQNYKYKDNYDLDEDDDDKVIYEKPSSHDHRRKLLRESKLFISNCEQKLENIHADGGRVYATIVWVPKNKKEHRTFLIGMDETKHFISMLPKPAKSIGEAHSILKPKDAKVKGTLRQGEWFFVPVTDSKIIKECEKRALNNKFDSFDNSSYEAGSLSFLEQESNHWVTYLIKINKTFYAKGLVTDVRYSRHEPLYLKNWYKVVRNTEITVPSEFMNNVRNWD